MSIINRAITQSSHQILILKGTPISKGIVEGRVFIRNINRKQLRQNYFKSRGTETETSEYFKALEQLRSEFDSIKTQGLDNKTGRQMIELSAALSRDEFFTKHIPEYILKHDLPAQTAILKKLSLLKIDFDKLANEYFRSRFDDFNALGNRLVDILNGDSSFDEFRYPAVFISEEISPSEIIRFAVAKKLLAVLSIKGGTTSHAAILAESYGIPAIFGVENLLSIQSGQRVIVDAYNGQVIVDPDAETLLIYQSIKKRREVYEKKLISSITQKPQMSTGEDLAIFANIGTRDDITAAKKAHADGIGLLRTEVFTMSERGVLNEDRMYRHYASLLAYTDMHPVTIRTLDLGGDKYCSTTGESPLVEANPFLGYRSTRMFIDDGEPLKIQLRALLRASVKNPNIKIMFPFVTTLEDIISLRAIYDEVAGSLKADLPHIARIPVGMMAEVPSSILCLEDFLPYVQFVSIGTNDLTQYTMAVDRNNPYVADYYQNAHPSVLRLIRHAITVCNKAGVSISLCGEMAKEPYFTRLFLGMGLRNFSLNPSFIPLVKFIAMNSSKDACESLMRKTMKLKTSGEIVQLLDEELKRFLQRHDATFDYENLGDKK